MKNRGLTLVELLAVFILLGIIALIAIPSIGGVKEKTKEKSFYNSSIGVIESVKFMKSQNELLDIPIGGLDVTDPNLKFKNQSQYTSGVIKEIDDTITLENVSNGEYCANGPIDNLEIVKGPCGQPAECFTVENGTITNYDFSNSLCTNDVIVPNKINGEEITSIGHEAFIVDKEQTLACGIEASYSVGVNGFTRENVTSRNEILQQNNERLWRCALLAAYYDTPQENPITSVLLPRTLKIIGENAFAFSKIEKLDLSHLDNLTRIESGAFSNNVNLTRATFPKNLEYIGVLAFSNIPSLDVNFGDLEKLEVIDDYSFTFTGLNKLDLSKSINVKEIGDYAFNGVPTNPFLINLGDKSKIERFGGDSFNVEHGQLDGWTNIHKYIDITESHGIEIQWLKDAIEAAGY